MLAGRQCVALVALAVAVPAFTGGATAAPDFSGIWARNSFNFETPASGQGPITNLRRVGKAASTYILGGDPVPWLGTTTTRS